MGGKGASKGRGTSGGQAGGLPALFFHSPQLILTGLLLLLQLLVFLFYNTESYPQIHDNLDLFMAHYEMMKRQGAWFAHGVTLPIMHGLNRDLFGSEFLLYNVLYILFPGIVAYLLGYFLKIAVGVSSFLLLARDFAGSRERFLRLLPVLFPVAAAFGMIPVFPTYGIAFTSVPFVIWLLRRIYYRQGLSADRTGPAAAPSGRGSAEPSVPGGRTGASSVRTRLLPWLLLFCYPTLSYFSYHGFFILCYMVVAFFILWVRDKRCPLRLFAATVVLSLGYVAFEYRLFAAMLLDPTVTIRTTMDHGELTLGQALRTGLSELVNASFHNEDSHTYLVLPVVLAALVLINLAHIRRHEIKRILTEPVNLLFLWILFNCLNFGLYEFAPYREAFEHLVPQLTGFEFARTAYFNTFLWYALLALILVRMSSAGADAPPAEGERPDSPDREGSADTRFAVTGAGHLRALSPRVAGLLAVLSAAVVMLVPQVYNDFYYTVYNHAYILLKHKETSTVNYREFYSEKLFARILKDIDYDGAWSAAYGMHPAVLNYNGIASVDGYLGMYPQEYKETWQRVEAPAFAGSPSLKAYFDGWGARVCLYSGSDENTYAPLRAMEPEDRRLMADIGELAKLDCRYIFSRIKFDNAEELSLKSLGTWDGAQDGSPYRITVYELPSGNTGLQKLTADAGGLSGSVDPADRIAGDMMR